MERYFDKYAKDKKLTKKLAGEYDFFVAQATIMPKVAASFGRIFGPKGKMPNPKAGCILPPNGNVKAVVDKLQKTVRVAAKTMPAIQCVVGNEEMKEEEVIENILAVYHALVKVLPNEDQNIKAVLLKKTMGKPVKV